MTTTFFTEDQMDRMNLKTMATPLPEGYTGSDLMSLLVTRSRQNKGVSDLSIQDTVDFYCRITTSEVQAEFDRLESTKDYKLNREIIELMHERPEELERALEAIEKGWRPGDPK